MKFPATAISKCRCALALCGVWIPANAGGHGPHMSEAAPFIVLAVCTCCLFAPLVVLVHWLVSDGTGLQPQPKQIWRCFFFVCVCVCVCCFWFPPCPDFATSVVQGHDALCAEALRDFPAYLDLKLSEQRMLYFWVVFVCYSGTAYIRRRRLCKQISASSA